MDEVKKSWKAHGTGNRQEGGKEGGPQGLPFLPPSLHWTLSSLTAFEHVVRARRLALVYPDIVVPRARLRSSTIGTAAHTSRARPHAARLTFGICHSEPQKGKVETEKR